MKYVENRSVRLHGIARAAAAKAECAVVDTHGVYTTLAHFLCGENPWGLHQDARFSVPLRNVIQGARIVEAAQHALAVGHPLIALHDDDHEALINALIDPKPTASKPMPPALGRAILDLLRALEQCTGTPSESTEPPTEPALAEPA